MRNHLRTRRQLWVETLEARAVPAVLATPGLPSGTPADANSGRIIEMSDDGNIILFTSDANNIATGVSDSNGLPDLFWRDLTTGQTLIVSATPGKVAVGFDDSTPGRAVLSGNGLKVAFVSTTLAPDLTGIATQLDVSSTDDVFLWTFNASSQIVDLVSATNSGNGNVRAIGETSSASLPNINSDGSKVAYLTPLDNNFVTNAGLADQATTNDIFVRNMSADNTNGAATSPVTVSAALGGNMIGNLAEVNVQLGGRYMSEDGNVFVYSTITSAGEILPGGLDQPTASGTFDIFLRDLSQSLLSGTRLVSFVVGSTLTAAGNVVAQQADEAIISADGSTVAFLCNAPGDATGTDNALQLVSNYKANGTGASLYRTTNLFDPSPDTFLVNAQNGTNNEAGTSSDVSPGNYFLSSDGAVVLFNSKSADLVAGLDTNVETDAYVRDFTGASPLTEVVSVGDNGTTGAAASVATGISGDGTQIVFETNSTNLLIGIVDDNGVSDVFLRDRLLNTTRMASTNPAGRVAGNGASNLAVIAEGGSRIGFSSAATNLILPNLTGTTVNLYAALTPLPSPLSLSKITSVSGQLNGEAQVYQFDATFRLQPIGQAIAPFASATDVRSATADFNGDGIEDVVYGVGPGGGSIIRLIASNGTDATTLAFEESFTGGVFVAAGDIDGDGIAEIVVSPDQGGGGRIAVFQLVGTSLVRINDFFGIDDPSFRGGARVALGDVNGDGVLDLPVAAGFGGGPRVALFNGVSVMAGDPIPVKLVQDFFTFSPEDQFTLRNGAFVTAGDFDADGLADLLFGGGPGGGPRIFALSGAGILSNVEVEKTSPLANFFAGDPNLRGGIRVTAKDVDGDLFADLLTGSGENEIAETRTYLGKNFPASGQGEPTLQESFAPFPGSSSAGVYVG